MRGCLCCGDGFRLLRPRATAALTAAPVAEGLSAFRTLRRLGTRRPTIPPVPVGWARLPRLAAEAEGAVHRLQRPRQGKAARCLLPKNTHPGDTKKAGSSEPAF